MMNGSGRTREESAGRGTAQVGAGVTLRHSADSQRKPTMAFGDSENIERISAHIAAHVGPVSEVFHEIVSEYVHIDVHWVKPSSRRPYHTLVTSGMSDRPMNAPPGAAAFRFAELLVTLPPEWPIGTAAFKDEKNFWPVRWLKQIARLPHMFETWVSLYHTIPNGDPPEPFAANTRCCCMLLVPPFSLPNSFLRLEVGAEKCIDFWALMPLYREEMDFKLKHGAEKLLARLDGAGINDVINPSRKNVCGRESGMI